MNSTVYYVYILSNKGNSVLYIGVTNNLIRRVYEHRHKIVEGFTKKYNISKLVYFEEFSDIHEALAREKQLKAGSRSKKIQLIENMNPLARDLYNELL